VAALANKYGFDCILVLSGEQQDQSTGNLLLDKILGAEIIWTTRPARDAALNRAFDEAWASGRRPYLIPLGGSTGLGALGYESAFQEFLAQEIKADWILVASSSGGTQAGLVLGAKRSGWKGKILGVSIDEPQKHLQQVVATIANDAAELLGENIRIKPSEVLVNADYLGAGYGILGVPEIEAIRTFARSEGLLLDPVYTGRAAAGLIDMARKGVFMPGETILFWHTGGTPALFADRYSSYL
jgi:1-aminocyclopropane-1-carboxylate deaminase/D-cysteine desulfhydrase-like pyridoxal-dependent ACC family enzyme